MIVELAVTDGPHAGKSFRFEEHATFIVGRSKNAHFSLPEKDPHLSRFHAIIEVNPPLCRLQHLSETNPTLLNGAAVTQADLRDETASPSGKRRSSSDFWEPTPTRNRRRRFCRCSKSVS